MEPTGAMRNVYPPTTLRKFWDMTLKMISKFVCKNCIFSKKDGELVTCNRFPPQSFPTTGVNPITNRPETGVQTIITIVQSHYWCGEHKPEPEPEIESHGTFVLQKKGES
jgi:hypothetical protein